MSERRVFGDADSQYGAVSMVLAEDPYVMHVVDHLERDIELEHPVSNWRQEMLDHLQEKYDVSLNVAHGAVSRCVSNFRANNGVETRADKT